MFAWIMSFFSKKAPQEQIFKNHKPCENVEAPYSLLNQVSLTVSQIQIIQDIITRYSSSFATIEDTIQKAFNDLISISSLDENIRLYLHELMFFTSIRMEKALFYVELAKKIISHFPHLLNYVESQIFWCFDNSADLFVYLSIQQGLLKEENLQSFEKSLIFDMNFFENSELYYNPIYRYMHFIYLHPNSEYPEKLKNISTLKEYYKENEYILRDPQYKQIMRTCLNTEEITAAIRSDDSKSIGLSNLKLEPNIIDRNEYVRHGCTLIEYSAFYGSINCFKKLISCEVLNEEKSAEIKISPIQTITICDLACCGGNLEICQILRNNGFKFTTQSLQFSIQYHRLEIFEWILNNAKIGMDEKCYKASIQYEFIPGIELYNSMKLKQTDINLELSKSNNYILFYNFIKIDESAPNIDSIIPIFLYNCVDCYRFFLTKKIVLQNCGWYDPKYTPERMFLLFKSRKRIPNKRNPFHIAINHQFMDLMKMLMVYGIIDLNSKEELLTIGGEGTLVYSSHMSLTPLAIAIHTDNVEIVEFLLATNDIDVNQTISDGGDSNHSSSSYSHTSIIRFAALHGNLQVLETLLKSNRIDKKIKSHVHLNGHVVEPFEHADEDIDVSKRIYDENVLRLLSKYKIK